MTAATVSLARIGPAFETPVPAAQQTFRALLEAMSRPGRVQTLPAVALRGVSCPPAGDGSMGLAMTAVLLALLDADTRLWLHGALHDPRAVRYFGFHTGAPSAGALEEGDFIAVEAQALETSVWRTARAGSDTAPQDGATLIVEVPSLQALAAAAAGGLSLRGPGIETVHHLGITGVPGEFWRARIACEADFPRGIDLVLTCGATLAAVPRSTRLSLEG